MPMLGAIIVPHPPLIIPTVGQGQEREVQITIDTYRAAAKRAAAWAPEVLIVASPHAVMYADYFHISPGAGASGSMASFGAPQTRLDAVYDAGLRQELVRQAEAAGTRAGTLGEKAPSLDHGTFLPLYFLREAGVDCPILRIGLSGFSPLEHYRLVQCIAQAVDTLGWRAVFDRRVTAAMGSGAFLQFLTMDPALCDRAAECGLRSFQIMTGALDGLGVEPKLLSYEDVTGMGYGVATFTVTGPDEGRRFGEQCRELERARLEERNAAEDPWVRLAWLSLDPIEKKPLRHFHPWILILSVGSFGCNLCYPFCQNHEISMAGAPDIQTVEVSPERLAEQAAELYPQGNGLHLQRAAGELWIRPGLRGSDMVNVLVSNGTIEEAPLRTLLPLIDAANIDLKGFIPAWYRRLGGDLEAAKRSITLAAEQCHVEMTTLLVPGENNSAEEVRALARWLASVIPDIPLHLSRFFSRYEMRDRPPTPVEEVYQLAEEARAWLAHVKHFDVNNIYGVNLA